MQEIHNPTKTPLGVRINGAAYIIRPSATVNLELDDRQLAKLAKMGCIVSEKELQVSDSVNHEFSGYADTFTNSLDSMTDAELRAMAKASGLNVHHKAGRAKLIEALSGDTE